MNSQCRDRERRQTEKRTEGGSGAAVKGEWKESAGKNDREGVVS